MAGMQDVERVALDEAREHVRHFFAVTATMTPAEVESLWRAERRSGVHWLAAQPEFLQAVAHGSWGPSHVEVAREIAASARLHAARLARWPRRRAVTRALEKAALAVFSTHDPRHPLGDVLRDRLLDPWQRSACCLIPTQRGSVD